MKTFNVVQKLMSAVALIAIGAVIVLPIEASVSSSGISVRWITKNYYSKKQSNKRYFTKTQTKKTYWSKGQTDNNFYRKSYIDDLILSYYTQTQVNGLLASYLTSTNATNTYVPLSGGTLTGGLSGTSFSYSSAQTKYLMVSGADLKPLADLELTASFGGVYKSAGVNSQAIASVNLPDGAIIDSITLYYYDTNAAWVGGYLMRTAYNSGTPDAISWNQSTGNGGLGTNSDTIDTGKETIDNSQYYYYITPVFNDSDPGLSIRGFRIQYQTTSL